MPTHRILLISSFIILASSCSKDAVKAVESLSDFKVQLGKLMSDNKIPGMIAGIRKNGTTLWSNAYGFADKEANKQVAPSSLFHLASLTKPFASFLIMQLVQDGLVNLNDPVSMYGIMLPGTDTIRVKHLLSHTSEGVPGAQYKYSGDRFALLDKVIQTASGSRFTKLLRQKFLVPKGLQNVLPSSISLATTDGYDTTQFNTRMVQGYSSNGKDRLAFPGGVSSAAGLIANLDDMLVFSDAIDDSLLLSNNFRSQMLSPYISNSGQPLPYGYGWFVQMIEGKKVLWHYGYWTGISSLIIKVPDKNISFVVLANSDMLSSPYPLGNGDIMKSPFAELFLKSFIMNGARL